MGSIAGEVISVSAHALRSSGLEILGSGIGSVSIRDLVAGVGELLATTPVGGFDTPVEILPLASVSEAWLVDADDRRLVLLP
ncbi:hypothetical protein A8H28_26650 [Burkholderia gladioli pv. gladioli]|nr:hypothetical protein A8H28_26650 [Burkholderia gladioli pv. gladioli]